MSVKIRVCFVCLGNICRSPTAEAVFAHVVREEGLADRFEIDSAGTGGWHTGEPAHAQTRAMARSRGVEITHLARKWVATDFTRFDHVLVMDHSNRRDVLRIAPDDVARAKVRLFREFEEGASHDEVPDPYYTGEFGLVFDICTRASRGFLAHVRRTHGL